MLLFAGVGDSEMSRSKVLNHMTWGGVEIKNLKNTEQGVVFGEEIDKSRLVVWKPLDDLQATNPGFVVQILMV